MRQQSHSVTLSCGCSVYVSCHPDTGVAHTRVIERCAPSCTNRFHFVGTRLFLWEMVPQPPARAAADAARRGAGGPAR